MRNCFGITLLEILVTTSIITLVLTLGIPSVLNAQKVMQLKGAAEVSYFTFQKARSAAISSQLDIMVVLNASNPWCIAISDSDLCDCQVEQDCTVNGIETKVQGTDFKLITMQDLRFGADKATVFDGVRGLAIGHAGSTVFSDGVNQIKLVLSNMGRVRLCINAGQLGGYESC